MPKASSSQKTSHICNRATVFYEDELCKGKGVHNITVLQSTTGHVLYSITLASKLETGASINGDIVDPWTIGFFDSNTKAFVVDLPPVWAPDKLLDPDPLESQLEPKDQHMV